MPSILIVDDVPEILKMLSAALENVGFEVTTAPDASSALQLCAARQFDAVLCDVRMPGVTGCEVARWMARNRPASQMVLMSGSETCCDDCPYLPKCALIGKPFRLRELLEVLSRQSHVRDR
jgi:CheY-like chemotaxis protein